MIDAWWSRENKDLPGSLARLLDVYSEIAQTSLELTALAACQSRAVLLSFTQRKRTYLTDHKYTMFGFLSVGAVMLREETSQHELDKSTSRLRSESSEMVPLRKTVPRT